MRARGSLRQRDIAALAAYRLGGFGALIEYVATQRGRVRCPACRGTGRGRPTKVAKLKTPGRGKIARRIIELDGPANSRYRWPCGTCERRDHRVGYIHPTFAKHLRITIDRMTASLAREPVLHVL